MKAPLKELKSKLKPNNSGIYATAFKLKTSTVGNYCLNVVGNHFKMYFKSNFIKDWYEN